MQIKFEPSKVKNDKVQIYDINIDAWRDITLEDVDSFENVRAAYGMLREELKKLLDHSLLIAQGKISITDWYLNRDERNKHGT